MITTYRSLLYEVEDGVATVTLNRPEELNAIDANMREDFARLSEALTTARDVRVVIFTGSGRAFSSGGSVSHFEKDWNTDAFRAESHRLSSFFTSLEMLEKPVIAALNGIATGAGLQLAMACDLRIAAETARLGFREHWLGLIPGHGGATRPAGRAPPWYIADRPVRRRRGSASAARCLRGSALAASAVRDCA